MTKENAIACEANRLSLCPIQHHKIDLSNKRELNNSSLEGFLFRNQHRWNPYLFHLIKVPWSVFGTLTWKQESKRRGTQASESRRREDFKWLIRSTGSILKRRGKHFAYYHAMEWGKAGECHFHFLIAQDGLEHISPSTLANTLQELWKHSNGLGVVQPFDKAKQFAGVSYCLKREYDGFGKELERFDYLSPRLQKIVQRNIIAPLVFENN